MAESNLTVVILTKNEETQLPRCLDGIPKKYPVTIVDSGSTDRTVQIAEARGCAVHFNTWPGFAEQRNFSIGRCGIDTAWILFIDADEVYPQEFFQWFELHVNGTDSHDIYMVPSIFYLRDKPLHRAPGYPIYHPRLVRRETAKFVTNHTGYGEAVTDDCRIGYSYIPYKHYFYQGEIVEWMHKHVDLGAKEIKPKPTPGAALTTRGKISVWMGRSAFRIFARFFYHYILRGGFLDGAVGLEFSLMFAWYEATIYLQAKAAEYAKSSNFEEGLPIDDSAQAQRATSA